MINLIINIISSDNNWKLVTRTVTGRFKPKNLNRNQKNHSDNSLSRDTQHTPKNNWRFFLAFTIIFVYTMSLRGFYHFLIPMSSTYFGLPFLGIISYAANMITLFLCLCIDFSYYILSINKSLIFFITW